MICYSDMMKINFNNKIMDRVEKYIQDYTRGCSNELSAVEYSDGRKVTEYHEWLTPDNARSLAKIAREEMIDKAVQWKENSGVNKPVINHSVLIKSTYGIAEGEWQGEQWLQYRWQSKIKDSDVQYWMELSDLEK